MAGVALLVVVGLGAVIVPKFMGSGKGAATDPNHAAGTPGSQVPAPTAGGTPQAGKPADTLKGGPPAGSSGKTQSSGTTESRRAALENQVEDSTKASAVIKSVASLYPQLTNPDDKGRADYVRYKAYVNLGDGDKACASILQAKNETTDPGNRTTYTSRAEGCGTPP